MVAVCRCDGAYPDRLRELADPPAVLHIAGNPDALNRDDGAAIVGARRGTTYGLDVARSLGRDLARAGIPVVSGMALGIDSAAHAGALEGLARAPASIVTAGTAALTLAPPVAVLAGGADVPYPSSRRRLHAALREHGAVVSELPPGFTAFRWCFVARNRLIAGLAALTVVVEATERSGSLTTADFASQLGRPVAAVPGPVTSRFSAGANALLAAGAAVARDARDVLDALLGPDASAATAAAGLDGALGASRTTGAHPAARTLALPLPPPEPTEPELRTLLAAIECGHGSLAELAPDAADPRQILADLTELELRGLVRREFGGRYVRAAGGAAR
jgi:DNA processing protein